MCSELLQTLPKLTQSLPELLQTFPKLPKGLPELRQSLPELTQSPTEAPKAARAARSQFWGGVRALKYRACASNIEIWNSSPDSPDLLGSSGSGVISCSSDPTYHTRRGPG